MKKRKQNRSNHFLSPLAYGGENVFATDIELIQFDTEGVTTQNVTAQENLKLALNHSKVNWFKVTGISDVVLINEVCTVLGLHSFDVKDLLSTQMTVKIVVYDHVTFILMPIFSYKENGVNEISHLAFALGKNYVVSIQESSKPIFEEAIKAIHDNYLMARQNGVDFLLYILLNNVNLHYLNVVMKMEDQLFELEDRLIGQDNSASIMNLLRLRRVDYIKLKRSVTSVREEYSNILHNTNNLISKHNIVYFNDYDDKLRTIIGNLDTCHELLNSLLDLYYNNTSMKMNEIMKRLTLISTIFIPLTFMAGVWGMNFKFMPELDAQYGYIIAWVTFIVTGICSFYFLKKKKWF